MHPPSSGIQKQKVASLAVVSRDASRFELRAVVGGALWPLCGGRDEMDDVLQ